MPDLFGPSVAAGFLTPGSCGPCPPDSLRLSVASGAPPTRSLNTFPVGLHRNVSAVPLSTPEGEREAPDTDYVNRCSARRLGVEALEARLGDLCECGAGPHHRPGS